LVYCKIRTGSVAKVKELYAAAVTDIEQGRCNWKSNFTYLQLLVMGDAGSQPGKAKSNHKQNKTNGNPNRVLWCKDFQTGSCSFDQQSHPGVFKGQQRTLWHVCATCMRYGKTKEFHREKSHECPNYVQ